MLVIAFLIMHLTKLYSEHGWLALRAASAAAPALVDEFGRAQGARGSPLKLPGETAAWYESLIYARVSGYVGNGRPDIGDHVAMGQVLATIQTPEMDADYLAAKAKLKAAQAQVNVRQAEAAFAKSTYERWRDSPKGVVSEQERERQEGGSGVKRGPSSMQRVASRSRARRCRAAGRV